MQLKTPSMVTLCPQISDAPSFLRTETRMCPKVQPLMVTEILENDTETGGLGEDSDNKVLVTKYRDLSWIRSGYTEAGHRGVPP